MFARIAFPIPHEDYFTYKIPRDLRSAIKPGTVVFAPLRGKPAAGVTIEIIDRPDVETAGLKQISGLGHPDFSIPEELLRLVLLTARRYGTTPGMVFKSVLPPGSLQRKRLFLYPGEGKPPPGLSRGVAEFLEKVRSHPGKISYDDPGEIKGVNREEVQLLHDAGAIVVSPFRAPQYAGSKEKWIRATDKDPSGLREGTKARHLFEILSGSKGSKNMAELKNLGFSSSSVATLYRKGLVEYEYRDKKIGDIGSMSLPHTEDLLELTLWQRSALEAICSSIDSENYKGFLLYGVTSSGKTHVYIEAARHALDRGRSVLILVPEISLTPQIIARFEISLKITPLVWHSRLTPVEKAIVFKQASAGEKRLLIGARSAIFTPLENLGLIVVDEEQDGSYKQDDPAPRYSARDLALERGKMHGATVVLGSATPSAESYQAALDERLKLHTLPQRVTGRGAPRIEIISTASRSSRRPETGPVFPKGFWPVSERLHSELSVRLKIGQQVIILLNRRGYSSSVVCFDCGWLGRCPDCDIGWTYHKSREMMICHYCGVERKGLSDCPDCGSARLSFRGAGTERLEETLKELFPRKRIRRLDSDSATGKWEARDILDEFGRGKIDILLGTQMVAKGHHFPAVELVGVIGADVGMSLPDFRATERVMQLLTQAAGRAGRSSSRKSERGLVMIQTFSPDASIYHFLIKDDYIGFIDEELKLRKSLNYPPFARLMLLLISAANQSRACSTAEKAREIIAAERREGMKEILGPAKSAIFRKGKQFRYQLLLKMEPDFDYGDMVKRINDLARRSRGVSLKFDIDPVNFLL
jgi:primosomal protein N' (replication factor Y)